MTGQVFLDTNILIYAALQTDRRADTARQLLQQRGLISVQVLNEFVNVARRKLQCPWPEILRALDAIHTLCPPPLPITLATHQAALKIAQRSGYQFYDALIVASALNSGCSVLFSEDLQDGQQIEGGLTIQNPFKDLAGH